MNNTTIEIPLGSKKYPNHAVLIDAEDYDLVKDYTWCYIKGYNTPYAQSTIWRPNKKQKQKSLLMHRLILGLEEGDKKYVDHINHNGLDNRRCNIRVVTCHQNLANQKAKKGAVSKYKGVHWSLSTNRWRVSIKTEEKRHYVGVYKNEKQAARAYDKEALDFYGPFALVNFQVPRINGRSLFKEAEIPF